jgi:hypothetical protein
MASGIGEKQMRALFSRSQGDASEMERASLDISVSENPRLPSPAKVVTAPDVRSIRRIA